MRYLALIYDDENVVWSDEEMDKEMRAYYAYDAEVKRAGVSELGEALQPTTTATTVRVRDDETLTTDGPFAESKEQLGGYYLLECANLDEAVKWVAKIPGAKHGSIEVRPIMELPDAPEQA